jgi:hypothetical protein
MLRHEERAALHERGLADHELDVDRDHDSNGAGVEGDGPDRGARAAGRTEQGRDE